MKLFKSKKAIAVAAVAGLALGATAAYALWSASGSGSGAATATSSQAITVTAASAGANLDFYPGAAAVAVDGTAANPNHFGVTFSGWSGLAITGITGANGTCAASDFTVTATGTATNNVSAQATADPIHIPGAVAMKSTAGDGCQNAVVTVSLTLTGGTQV